MRKLGLLLLGALAARLGAADLPALNPTATSDRFPGKFIWADLFTADQPAAAQFYTGLFDWTATTIARNGGVGPHDYIVLENEGRPIAGIAVLRPDKMPSHGRGRWVGYISVPDVGQALASVTAAGGRIVFPLRDLPQRGTQAIVVDPNGAYLGLLRSSSGDPAEYRPDPGDWTWAELFARDPAAAAHFYSSVFGYESVPDERMKRPDTFLLSSGAYARASIAPLPQRPEARPAWLGYVRVSNLDDALARTTRLGGRVLVGPRKISDHDRLAIIADVVGAPLGLVENTDDVTSAPAPTANP